MRSVLAVLLRPASPMNRVLEIEEIISELLSVDEVSLLQYPQWNEVADEILKKLRNVRSYCFESSRAALLTPPSSEGSLYSDFFGSSSGSSGDFSPSSSTYETAAQAFDRQIYSRCVQIIEAALRQSPPLEMALISLAHHSYQSMVEDAEDVEDSSKFALWWCQFLEKAEQGTTAAEKGEMFDYRLTALERLFQLDPPRRRTTSIDILQISIKSFKLTTAQNRHFHPKCLRRLEKLIYWIDETRPYCEGYQEFTEAEAVVVEAIKTSLRDQRRFETEKGSSRVKDVEYTMCCDLLAGLAERTRSDEEPPAQMSIDQLMDKVFLDNHDNGYASLPRTDTEEDIVLRL